MWWLSEQIATMNFEKINLGYSMKNIPIPPKKLYLKFMLDKVESFIKRLRWKAFYFDKKQLNQDEEPLNTHGFRSEKTPPTNNDLIPFENDIYELIHNLRYRKVTNKFQKNLLKDIASLNSSQNIIVPEQIYVALKSTTTKNYSWTALQQPTKKQKIQQLQKLTKKLKPANSNLTTALNLLQLEKHS